MKKLSIAAIVLASLAIVGEVFIFATQKEDSEEVQKRAIMTNYRVYAPVIPDTMTFAGERVPLDKYYVREGLDNELIINMYKQSSTLLYFKRANRYFPIIEPILKQNGIPEDFKYLCEIDMRNNLEASTEAACKYLRSLYNRFHSWTAAAAAYNCGENGLSRRMETQDISSYYDVRLNTETSRYVYRILAMKLIMQHPQQFGYYLRHCDLYPTIPTRSVTLSGQNVDLYKFAKSNGTTYKMLRDLNPWIQTDNMKNKANKSYTVVLPITDGTMQKTLTKGHKNTRLITGI